MQYGTFYGGDGDIVTVYLAVLVDGITAYEGVIDADVVEKVEGLRADNGTGGAADNAAADVHIKRSAAGKVIGRLHRVGVNGGAVHIVKKVAQGKCRGATAERHRASLRNKASGLFGHASFLGNVFVQLAVKGLVGKLVNGHNAAVGADDQFFALHVRELLAQGGHGDIKDLTELFDIHFSAALENADYFLLSDTGFQITTFQKNETQALAGSRWAKVYRKKYAEIYDKKLVNTDKNSDTQRAAEIDFERNAHF